MAAVIVHTQPGWGACHEEIAWLSESGDGFEERDSLRNAGMNALMALGSQATPTTMVQADQQKKMVVGFDRQRLARLLAADDAVR